MNNLAVNVSTNSLEASGAMPSILSEKRVSLPIGGKIRAGIKVMTKAAASNEKVKAAYEKGVADGKPFDDIAKDIAATGFSGTALVPKNVQYFTARRNDFAMPEVADRIMAMYGEDRGDGVKRLYRFPVVFPVDAWQVVLPHALKCYTSSELKFWSEYDQAGTRYCKTRAAVQISEKNQRAVRLFGGRPIVLREENSGLCVPEKCSEYQNRKCNLTGSFLFYMPGVPGTSVIELPTNSFYAMNAARNQLELVSFTRGGKISGLHNGKPIFWITKKEHDVSHIDNEGTVKKVSQWLIEIEADIDMTKLLRGPDEDDSGAEAENAHAVLTGHSTQVEEKSEVITPESQNENAQVQTGVTQGNAAANKENVVNVDEIRRIRAYALEKITLFGIATESYIDYAVCKWGEAWSRDLTLLQKVQKELENAEANPPAYKKAVLEFNEPF